MRTAAALLILVISSFSSFPSFRLQAQTSIPDPQDGIKQLLAEERWQEIVRLVEAEAEAEPSADLTYYYGIALARLERWDEAKRAFARGLGRWPGDKRFPLELAGVCFRQKNYREAARHLRIALRIDPDDAYANDFLASVYLLEGNLEAALEYWNRVSKPEIEEVRHDPLPRVDPVLLDSAFAFAPASRLRLADFQTTQARVSGMGIFPEYRFDLEARADGKFDVVFRARERNGWGGSRWEGLMSLLRGLPFQAVQPEYFNINRRAINVESLLRWDRKKRRAWAKLSGPMSGEAKRRYQFDLDLRDEDWAIRGADAAREQIGSLKLRRQAIGASVISYPSGRTSWSTGVELSHRGFDEVAGREALTPDLLASGFQLEHLARVDHQLVRMPERRLFVSAGAESEIGRNWSGESRLFAKLQSSIEARWSLRESGDGGGSNGGDDGGDDYVMRGRISAGVTGGRVPFDELFILGIERDNDLLLRGHVGTRDGRKGSAPMGRRYLLVNWEIDKTIYRHALFELKLGPFLDSGRIGDAGSSLGSRVWLWDLGAQAKARVLGVGFVFSYGKDLRSGRNAFYVTMLR